MRAYERLLNYVKVHTTSDPNSGTHPSTLRQFDLAKILVDELKALGLADAHVDEHCYVYATLPATPGQESAKPLGFIAHMDTADDASGENVQPQIHENYDGGAVTLPATGTVLDPEVFPFLKEMKGQTLITTDGSTLLGADDKAGVAEIMTALERIISENRPHGKLCIGFTPDEEIGEGASLFDVPGFGAAYAYTVDGEDVGEISYENFNAAAAVVTVHGFSVHPGSAKNTMINAQNVAMEFHAALPAFSRPEHTEGREGYYHPTDISGTPDEVKLCYILRDFDAADFDEREATLRRIAAFQNARYGEGTVTVEVRQQYRNMAEKFDPADQLLIDYAVEANREVGIEPVLVPARGGTDGAQLTFRGLPCPNIATGGYNAHSVREFVPVRSLELTVDLLERLVAKFAAVRADGTVATPTAGAADGE